VKTVWIGGNDKRLAKGDKTSRRRGELQFTLLIAGRSFGASNTRGILQTEMTSTTKHEIGSGRAKLKGSAGESSLAEIQVYALTRGPHGGGLK